MRVLFITSAYPSNADDPRGTFIHVLARSLVDEGLDITVLAPGSPGARTSEVRDGVKIRRATYWVPRWQSLATGQGGILSNLRSRPWLVVQVPMLIAALCWHAFRLSRNTDIIHAHWIYPAGLAGAFAAKLRKQSFVVTSHGSDVRIATKSRLVRAIVAWVGNRADACIGVSEAVVRVLVSLGVHQERVRFIPLGVEVGALRTSEALQRIPEATRFSQFAGLRVVYAGRLVPSKSVSTLLDAQRELVSQGLPIASLIIGDGPCGSVLRTAADRPDAGLVLFLGAQPSRLLPSLIALGDALVLPSLAEGRGMVIVEAMALGLPVVVSDIEGPRELVSDGETGFLFAPGDSHSLACQLSRLKSDGDLARSLGSRGQRRVLEQGLTAQRSAKRHVAAYRSVTRFAGG
jgi:glycosyltransferase involved in cell wall biosynthesis